MGHLLILATYNFSLLLLGLILTQIPSQLVLIPEPTPACFVLIGHLSSLNQWALDFQVTEHHSHITCI